MNWSRIKDDWNEFKSKVKLQWDKLPDAQLEVIAGSRDQLIDWIQKTYGVSRHAAEWQLSGWQQRQRDDKRPE